jgi:hypothetical protein
MDIALLKIDADETLPIALLVIRIRQKWENGFWLSEIRTT